MQLIAFLNTLFFIATSLFFLSSLHIPVRIWLKNPFFTIDLMIFFERQSHARIMAEQPFKIFDAVKISVFNDRCSYVYSFEPNTYHTFSNCLFPWFIFNRQKTWNSIVQSEPELSFGITTRANNKKIRRTQAFNKLNVLIWMLSAVFAEPKKNPNTKKIVRDHRKVMWNFVEYVLPMVCFFISQKNR